MMYFGKKTKDIRKLSHSLKIPTSQLLTGGNYRILRKLRNLFMAHSQKHKLNKLKVLNSLQSNKIRLALKRKNLDFLLTMEIHRQSRTAWVLLGVALVKMI